MKQALIRTDDGVLLAHGFCVFEPKVGETVLEVPDEFDREPLRWRWTGSDWVVHQEPLPDGRGFEGALQVAFAGDMLGLNRLLGKYPLLIWSLRDQAWPSVEALLKAAAAAGDLTPAQSAALKQAAIEKHIPVTL